MCTGRPKNVQLPAQIALCDSENSACTYAELKTGFSSWEKRMTVMTRMEGEPPKLIIYTYFLLGLGAGDPKIGQIIFLDKLEGCETKKEKDGFVVKLKTAKGEKVTLKFTGKESAQWTSAILTGEFKSLVHNTHRTAEKKVVRNEMTAELKDKSDEAKEGQKGKTEEAKRQKSPSVKSKDEDKKTKTQAKPKSKTDSQKIGKKTKSTTRSDKDVEKPLTLADTQTFEMNPEQFVEKEKSKSEKELKKTQTLTETATSSGKKQKKNEEEHQKPTASAPTPDTN